MTFTKDEGGATTIEYGIIGSIMTGLIVVSWTSAYQKIAVAFDTLTMAIDVIQDSLRGCPGFDRVNEEDSAGSHDDLKNQNQLVANNNAHFDSVRLAA